jgi:antitoxin VapB
MQNYRQPHPALEDRVNCLPRCSSSLAFASEVKDNHMSLRRERNSEVESKLRRLRRRLADRKADAVLLSMSANTAWLTAGAATYVNEATDGGASSILVTADHAYVLTDNIEAPRLRQEEVLSDLGFDLVVEPWYARDKALETLAAGKRLAEDRPGADLDVSADLRQLRSVLQAEEMERLRQVCSLASEAMDEAVRAVRPGDSEHTLAGRLAGASRARGGSAIVNLVASDDRIYQFRHPLPTARRVERYAMLVLCMRLEGLIAAVTRLVHFGPMPTELRDKALAVAYVDAALILGTQPGRTLSDLFEVARKGYQEKGHPEAIEEHHQGGSIAYRHAKSSPIWQTT